MKNSIVPFILIVLLVTNREDKNLKPQTMHFNAGIITSKLSETKKFYLDVLHFQVKFENEWYLLLHAPGSADQISFMLPDHPTQQPIFQPEFQGKGVFFTIEVDDVDAEYKRLSAAGIPISVTLRDEPWGERHFSIVDPNGVGVDFVGKRKLQAISCKPQARVSIL